MAFIRTSFTASSAIATNGTQTFGYPTRQPNTPDVTTQGDFRGSFGHEAFAEGLQNVLKYGTDFTLTFGNSTITFTYLGTQSIPASTVIAIDLHTVGQNSQDPYGLQFSGNAGDVASQAFSGTAPTGISNKVQGAGVRWINFGTPITSSATTVVNASAAAESATTLQTLTTAVTLDVPRNLIYKSSSTLDVTQTVTARGFDDYGVAMTETASLNGTTSVVGKKAFAKVVSWQVGTVTTTGTISIGVGVLLGSPAFVPAAGAPISDILNGALATRGTWVAGDLTAPTATTGDVRGTWSPNTAPSTNTNTYEALVAVPDSTFLGLPQFAG